MKTLKEGEKRNIAVTVVRVSGTGAIPVTSPQRRILDASLSLISDWAAATWDADLAQIGALFDATLAGLSAPGTYFMDLRGSIGSELYRGTVKVVVVEAGP